MKIIKRVLKIVLYVLLSLIILFSVYSLFMTKVLNKSYVNIFGYTYYVVASGSMSGTIEVNDIIVVDIGADYKEDDIITFIDTKSFITHRVVKIEGDRVVTKGDVNQVNDEPINKNDVIGKVVLIISVATLLKLIGVLLLLILLYIVINFDKIFKKYIVRKHEKEDIKTPLEYTQTLPIVREISEDKYTVKEEDIPKAKIEKPVLDAVNEGIENTIEKKFITTVLNKLNVKEKKMKLTKSGSLKLKYLYELAMTVKNDPDGVNDCIKDAPFKENYDYEFEAIGFTKEIQDSLYEMPIYVFLKLMLYSILYDEEEYFDALFKVFKYQIKIDQGRRFIKDKRRVDEVTTMIEKVIGNVGYTAEFEIERIKEKVKTTKLLRSIEIDEDDEKQFVSIVLKILASKGEELKVSKEGSLKLRYIYELVYTIMINPEDAANTLKDLPFTEKYDYDFKDINFTEKIQEVLYKMPIHVFFKLLVYSLLYEEEEYFDAIFKVLRYRMRDDNTKEFLNDNELNGILSLIENVVTNIGTKEQFGFDEIKERVETDKVIKKIENSDKIKVCPNCGKPYITKCPNCH